MSEYTPSEYSDLTSDSERAAKSFTHKRSAPNTENENKRYKKSTDGDNSSFYSESTGPSLNLESINYNDDNKSLSSASTGSDSTASDSTASDSTGYTRSVNSFSLKSTNSVNSRTFPQYSGKKSPSGRTTRHRKKSRRGGKSRKNNKSKRKRHHK
jgi:hypothetical protein